MLLNQSFAVPVRPVSTAAVVTREHPFFDPGASTSVMFAESTGSGLAQTASESTQVTATLPPLGVPSTSGVRDVSGSATRPVQGPGTSDVATQPLKAPGAELATQPLQAPVAGTATQPPQRLLPGVRPDEFAGESDSEAEVGGEPASPAIVHVQGDLLEDATDQDLSEDANYRETIRGVRSFMGWHQITDYDSTASSLDDNPFAGSRTKPTGKVSVKVDEWLCKKFERLNVIVAEGCSSRNFETGGLQRDQFVKTLRSSKWYAMHTDKKDSASATVCDWSPEPAKLISTFTRVARRSLPSAPASRTFSQDTLRRWEWVFREQSVMCNQAAGLSRCLTLQCKHLVG